MGGKWRKLYLNNNNKKKHPSETELSDEEIANLSGAEFKTLVIRMLTEMVEYGCKIKEEMKAIQSEIKKNIQETNSEGKETGIQINDLDQKEERNIQPEKNEETRIQKNEESRRNLLDNFKHSNIGIIGVPEGEDEEQETENLFEQIMKENLPNLVKVLNMQVQDAQSPKEVGPKEEHTKTHHH